MQLRFAIAVLFYILLYTHNLVHTLHEQGLLESLKRRTVRSRLLEFCALMGTNTVCQLSGSTAGSAAVAGSDAAAATAAAKSGNDQVYMRVRLCVSARTKYKLF